MMRDGRLGWVGAALLVAGLAGCGGGGGGAGDSSAGSASDEASRALVMLGVGAIDSLAGVPRMLERAAGFAVIEGPAGNSASATCAGGGSVLVQKQTTTTARLTAANCKLRTDSPLVYNGVWNFTITTNTIGSGTCPAGGCELEATVDVSGARFGYGTATEQVLGRNYWSRMTSQGRYAVAWAGNETVALDDGTTVSFGGPPDLLTMTAPGVSFQIMANLSSGTISMSGPGYVDINTTGTNVVANLDMDKDNVIEKSVVIPWSDFLE